MITVVDQVRPWLTPSNALAASTQDHDGAHISRKGTGTATVWLVATGWLFHAGATTLGYAFGIPLILVALLVSVTHICIPSMVYNALFRPHRAAPSVRTGV
jgi:hypothetical protein